jgi:hypothetical protein
MINKGHMPSKSWLKQIKALPISVGLLFFISGDRKLKVHLKVALYENKKGFQLLKTLYCGCSCFWT